MTFALVCFVVAVMALGSGEVMGLVDYDWVGPTSGSAAWDNPANWDPTGHPWIDYLREQVRVLVEQQEKQNKRILLSNSQRMRVAAGEQVDVTPCSTRRTEFFGGTPGHHPYDSY